MIAAFTGFLVRAWPSPELFLWPGPALLGYGIAAAAVAARLQAGGLKTSYTRKVFHFLIFTAAGLVQVVWGLPGVCLFGGLVTLIVLHAVWRGEGYPFYEAMARESDRPRRSMFILVPLATTAIGGLAANLLFPQVAFVGYLVCGWGDALGEPVGARWGHHRYRVPSIGGVVAYRSLEGSAAVWIGGSVAASAGLALAGLPLLTAIGVGAACGLFGALVEAVSNHGLDNLTIQVAASLGAFLLLG